MLLKKKLDVIYTRVFNASGKKILEAELQKTAYVQPLAPHLTKHPSRKKQDIMGIAE